MIDELLAAHYGRPYPSAYRTQIADADIELLDADVVGLASQYLEHGSLTQHQVAMMRGCLEDVERVLPQLSGEAREYFRGVRDLAAGVLARIDAAPAV